jgi:hypothetical protein
MMLNGLESSLHLTNVNCTLTFKALYDRVNFPPETERAEPSAQS